MKWKRSDDCIQNTSGKLLKLSEDEIKRRQEKYKALYGEMDEDDIKMNFKQLNDQDSEQQMLMNLQEIDERAKH